MRWATLFIDSMPGVKPAFLFIGLMLSFQRLVIAQEPAPKKFDPVVYHFRDDSLRNETYFFPVLMYTGTNRLMPALCITNNLGQNKRFGYTLFPAWSSAFDAGSGFGTMKYLLPQKALKPVKLSLTLQAKSFFLPPSADSSLRYYRWEAGMEAGFGNEYPGKFSHTLAINYHQNGSSFIRYIEEAGEYRPDRSYKHLRAIRLKYEGTKTNGEKQLRINSGLDLWKSFGRTNLRVGYEHRYAARRLFSVQWYSGAYLFSSENFTQLFDARLNPSAISYRQDVFYDHFFIGRNPSSTFYDQQGISGHGCMYTMSVLGKTWEWTSCVTGTLSLPIDLPLHVYLSTAVLPDPFGRHKLLAVAEGGLLLMPVKKYFEIAFPVFTDKQTKETLDLNSVKYLQRIRFIVNFDQFKHFEWPKGKKKNRSV